MNREAPRYIQENPRLMEVWAKSGHILPPEAFEPEFAKTLLLPIVFERIKREAATLRHLIATVPGLNVKTLSDISRTSYSTCWNVLYLRNNLEWRLVKSKGVRAFPVNDDRVARLVPEESEIRAEYLVAELERAGVEFRVEALPAGEEKLVADSRHFFGKEYYAGLYIWLGKFAPAITSYVKKRDGLSAQCHRR